MLQTLGAAFLAVYPSTAFPAAQEAPWPGADWPRSSPAAQGMESSRLEALAKGIREGEEFPDLHGLLIARDGYVVLEEYFAGHGPDELHTLQSVSKSFTSAILGIAVGQGKLRADEKVLAFFPDAEIRNRDSRKEAMRVEDLLTMRSGTDYHERGSDSPHWQLNRLSRGWDRFVLDRPMVRQPGAHFQYDSGGVILLSAILKSRTGMHADAFADRFLFPRIGIEQTDWFRNSEGHPHTGGGLELRLQDMARLGLLYLRGGRWGDRQVVPADWVARSTRRLVTLEGRGHVVGYGYLWWILEPDPAGPGKQDIYAAMGFRAQYIFVVPEHDLVVAVQGGTHRHADEKRPIDFLYTHILPAVRR
jgi:CubicO group peptidase (beta-lactamase class C family)